MVPCPFRSGALFTNSCRLCPRCIEVGLCHFPFLIGRVPSHCSLPVRRVPSHSHCMTKYEGSRSPPTPQRDLPPQRRDMTLCSIPYLFPHSFAICSFLSMFWAFLPFNDCRPRGPGAPPSTSTCWPLSLPPCSPPNSGPVSSSVISFGLFFGFARESGISIPILDLGAIRNHVCLHPTFFFGCNAGSPSCFSATRPLLLFPPQ